MSEYQRYEFMAVDRPLTREQLAAVNALSSHIEASSGHALIEYHWGDFKHDPLAVLYQFFDGFLYWANWGAPQLALRFPHNILPADLSGYIGAYDLDDAVAFMQHADYDILDIHFGELEGPDEWMEYELGSLIGIRDELMEGDLRALYIVWLAFQRALDLPPLEADENVAAPPVPPGLATPTTAQQALADLLQVPQELLIAAGRHSAAATTTANEDEDDFVIWTQALAPDRVADYMARLARNEAGLSHALRKELRDLHRDTTNAATPTGERALYSSLHAESAVIKSELAQARREQERLARERVLQDIHDHAEIYWGRVDEAVARGSGPGYDEATSLLAKLRAAANHYHTTNAFQARFQGWVQPHLRRPAFVKRLKDQDFALPLG